MNTESKDAHRGFDTHTPIRPWMQRILKTIVSLVVLAAVFFLGLSMGGVGSGPRNEKEAAAGDAGAGSLWTCSMHPQIRQSQPGQCPICGMDLVPLAGPQEAAKTKTVKYACSMFCVPPMDRPGKCPVCGMDMVPVEEHGDETFHDEPAGANELGKIKFSEKAKSLAQLQVSPVERRFVANELRLFGKVDFDETRLGSISARVAGRLDRLFVNYTGVRVQKGEHLVSLYSPELLTAQEELLQSARGVKESDAIGIPALKEAALRSLAMTREKLLLWGLTQEQLDEIETRGTASDHTTIFAALGGVVIDKQAVEGMYVDAGDRIYTIADLSVVWVKLDAYESDLPWLRYGQEVEFHTEAYPGEVFHGRISFIDPILSSTTRTVKVRVNVPNPDGRLKPEMFIRATVRSKVATSGKVMDEALAGKWISPMHPEIIKDGPGTCDVCGMPLVTAESLGYVPANATQTEAPLVIPATAPLITGRRAIVYLQDKDRFGAYEGREIELGPRAGEFYTVREGLAEGEMVVSQGNIYLDSAVQILARRSMMSPASDDASTMETQIAVPPEFKAQLDGVFDAYFAIQDALSHDRFNEAQTGARQLQKALTAVESNLIPNDGRGPWMAESSSLTKNSSAISSAKDIEAARAAYEHLSNGLITLVKKYGSSGKQPIRRYHCPMAFNDRGADWLQNKEGLENPYFGSAMFTCGVLKEIIEPGPAEKAAGE